MVASRRDFLRQSAAGAVAWNALGLATGRLVPDGRRPRWIPDERAKLAAFALR